ncbi:MAG: AAA family ATPase [Henriciella sp.]|nr:AAA family ATPase [Henriciella sp.]
MAGQVIAIANSKGGVGKTTTTVTLAEAHAAMGLKTLVIDLDSQANASLLVYGHDGDEHLYDAISNYRTISDYLRENFLGGEAKSLPEFIVRNASDVTFKGNTLPIDLVPATPGLRRAERELIYTLTEQGFAMSAIEARVGRLLSADLTRLRKQYDVIICDCPPGISAMTEAVLAAAELIIVPTIPDFMSTLGIDVFVGDVMRNLKRREITHKPVVLATRFDNSANQNIVLNAMREGAAEQETEYNMFRTVIPNLVEFAANPMELNANPTLSQKWPGEALAIIDALYNELKEHMI